MGVGPAESDSLPSGFREAAQQKTRLLAECYPSQSGRGWFDDEAFLGLMRVRGVQCRARYAEGFTIEKAVLDPDRYSVN